jgi:carboxymethylenebutenolidase
MMHQETHFIATADGPMGVVLTHPDGDGPYPVVVMFHDGPGLRDANRLNAKRIAAHGFAVVMPDRYHRHGDFKFIDPYVMRTAKPDDEVVTSFRAMFGSTTDDHMRTDVAALLLWIRSRSVCSTGKLAAIGYCIGARTVLRTMADHNDVFAAAVCFHPSFCADGTAESPHASLPSLKGRLYVGIGTEDKMQSIEMNQPFLDAVTAVGGEVDIFEGADHGFAVPGPQYHDTSADIGYEKAIALFHSTLS